MQDTHRKPHLARPDGRRITPGNLLLTFHAAQPEMQAAISGSATEVLRLPHIAGLA
jgi:hypothetical protein